MGNGVKILDSAATVIRIRRRVREPYREHYSLVLCTSMQKQFFRFRYVIGCAVLALAAVPFLSLLGADSASVSYLKGKPLTPWSIMALSAVGESPSTESLKTVSGTKAIDLEAPILALIAARVNPRTFGSEDLIAKLKGFYDGAQLGEAGIMNDDIFGLLALIASGESVSEPIVAGIKSLIVEKQNADGGFSFAVGGTSDTNTTAAAIMALRVAEVSATAEPIVKAVSYLRQSQNDDGGFPYDPKSSWGTGSDASSDAWVIMAARSAGEDPASWQKNGASPITHLEGLKQEGGFYLYQAGGAEDSFTPVTTSYALLALSGKTLPVRAVLHNAPAEVSFSVQIEGRNALLCDADGEGITALDALKTAASSCNLQYHLQSSSLGEYVDEIAGEKAGGASGWLYRVNGAMPAVGAGSYKLSDGDTVRWYFGNLDGSTAASDIRVEIPLSVTIPAPQGGDGGGGGDTPPPEDEDTVSILVGTGGVLGNSGSAIGFGTLARGAVATKEITLRNGGAVATSLSVSVSGGVFRRYLRLNEKAWREYRAVLASQASTSTTLSLSVPADYDGAGLKTGALVFWATPVAQ